jgi:hypothetical protein
MTGSISLPERLKQAVVPTRKSIGLSGLVSISVAAGMAMAHNRLIDAGLVGAREGAQVLALPGFAFLFAGLAAVVGAIIHAQVLSR